MRVVFFTAMCCALVCLASCDSTGVYETNHDFQSRYWLQHEMPEFEFEIADTALTYNLYVNIRNDLSFPNENLYLKCFLSDSTGSLLQEKLVSELLFEKSGKPLGSTVLGDIYDHQGLLFKSYTFDKPGLYTMRFAHYMRRDTVKGMLAVGVRVEKSGA